MRERTDCQSKLAEEVSGDVHWERFFQEAHGWLGDSEKKEAAKQLLRTQYPRPYSKAL